MTAVPKPRSATYDDLVALPENVIGEIIDGELVSSPRPAPTHAGSSAGIGMTLGPLHGRPGGPHGPGGWWILDEPELHLGRHVLVPDLGGWRRERMAHYPTTAYFELPPDWVCEVISPASRRRDRVQKMAIYGEFAIPWLWLVDPQAQTVEVFARRDEGWMLVVSAVGDELEARLPPFEAVSLDLSRWWEGAPPGFGR